MCGGSTSTTFPGPTPQETELEQMQLDDLKQQNADIANFKPFVLQQYGLQEVRGQNPEKKKLSDQIDSLEASGKDPNGPEVMALRQQYTAKGFDNGGDNDVTGYEYTPEQKARNADLQSLQDQALQLQKAQGERQKQAIAGTLPLSQALVQSRDKDFAALKEDQGRNGNAIVGDSLDGAVAKTTSGQQALESLKKTYGLLADSEQNAAISQAGLPSVYGQQYQISSQNANPGAPNPAMMAINPSSYSAAYQPYQFGRSGQFQSDAGNAANNQSFYNTMITGLLNGAGKAAAAYAGG